MAAKPKNIYAPSSNSKEVKKKPSPKNDPSKPDGIRGKKKPKKGGK